MNPARTCTCCGRRGIRQIRRIRTAWHPRYPIAICPVCDIVHTDLTPETLCP